MNDVSIRQCTRQDLPAALRLYARLFTDYGDPVPGEGLEGRFGEYLLVAELGGEIVGLLCAERQTIAFMKSEIGRAAFPDDTDYLEVQELYVLPEHRNRGIGTQLVRTALEKGRANGLDRSMVYSDMPDYVRTAGFYERCGCKMWHIFMTQ